MMRNLFTLLVFSLLLFSCNEERVTDSKKASQLNDSVSAILSKNWVFNIPNENPKVKTQIESWHEWWVFKNELAQKPKASLNAFRLKTRNLTEKGQNLETNLPDRFNKPAVKSRIAALNTKLKSMETYMSLDYIQTPKIIKLVNEITTDMRSIQDQMNEIIVKSEIPKEEGELIMLQALDTARHARREVQEPKQ